MVTSLNTKVPERDLSYQVPVFLRRDFVFGDFPAGSLTKVVGGIPANGQVIGIWVTVTVAAVGGTINIGTLNYDGTTTVPAAFGSAMVITATTGPTPADDILLATAGANPLPTQLVVVASAALTAGAFSVIALVVPKNPAAGV